MPSTEDWVAAGAAPAPSETPAVEAPPIETPAVEVPAVETPPTEALTEAPVADPVTSAEIEALEAWLDDEGTQKLSIPLTARVPRKVNGVEERVPIAQALKEHQLEAAWTRNMQRRADEQKELARMRREVELERAVVEAERKLAQEETDRVLAARGDPEAMARLAEDAERLRSDPSFRKLHEDATAARRREATDAREAALAQADELEAVASDAAAYITRVAAQYPGVDPDEIRQRFAEGLQAGTLQLHARTVDQLFAQEKAKLDTITARATDPLAKQLDEVRQQLAALQADRKNADTLAALRTPAAPTTGAPARTPTPPASTPLPVQPGETLTDRGARWAQRR